MLKIDQQKILPRLSMVALCAILLATLFTAPAAKAQAQVQPQLRGDFMRGAAIVQSDNAPFGSAASFDSLQKLHDTGATWVSIIATFHVGSATSEDFHLAASDPSVAAVGQMMDAAHSLGFRVMLQPIVLSDDGVWNGLFQPDDPGIWFANYADFLFPYAQRAQASQIDLFCVGTEFFTLSGPNYSANWASVIAKTRTGYFGPLTYSANWGDKKTPEFNTINWWNLLDYIGISAYFPLSWNDFTEESLRQGWFSYTDPFSGTPDHLPGAYQPGATFHWHDELQALFTKWNKSIIFTRIGFASSANSPGRWDVPNDPTLELSVQANAYEATFRAWQATGWLKGTFWASWYSDPNAGGPTDNGETPQNKPAQDVLKTWYTGTP